jgi:hypothetical protein
MITVDDVDVDVKTLHAVPFNPFKVDVPSPQAEPVFADMAQKAQSSAEYLLIQGDLNPGRNNPPLKQLMPGLIRDTTYEIEDLGATIPLGECADRIVFRGLRMLGSEVKTDVLTDHFPVVTTFGT